MKFKSSEILEESSAVSGKSSAGEIQKYSWMHHARMFRTLQKYFPEIASMNGRRIRRDIFFSLTKEKLSL